MTPLLSVVIPTFRRPAMLRNAIASALLAAPGGEVEVVVVPNGPDTSWKRVAQAFREDERVSWHELKTGHACAARNHGLSQARGKYVRFLDDDDYLYPAAADQLSLIESRHADVCSAPLQNILPSGRKGQVFDLPNSEDYPIAALLSIAISGLTQGSVFLKSAIEQLKWREDVVLYDDYLWTLGLAESRELDWFQTANPVGAYIQHDNARLSRIRRSGSNSRPLVAAIFKLHGQLAATGRASPERTRAVATALLTHAHSAFPSNPLFLSQTIKQAQYIAPAACPMQPIFRDYPWLAHNLLATEWMAIAPRYFTRSYRRATWLTKGIFTRV